MEKEVSSVLSLLVDRDGTLWIGTSTGLDRLNEQGFYQYSDRHARVNAIREAPDGRVWVVRSRLGTDQEPVCEAGPQTLRCYGEQDGIPFRYAVLLDIDHAGNLLIGSGNTILKWNGRVVESYVPNAIRNAQNFNGLRAVLSEAGQSILVGMASAQTGQGLQRFDQRRWGDALFPGASGSTLSVSALFRDREQSLWVGTSDNGLLRVSDRGVERFKDTDGLTGNYVSSIFEDSEGNIWIATTKGLDCFRHLAVTSYSLKEGLKQESVESVERSRNGGVWIGNRAGLAYLDRGIIKTIGKEKGFPGERVTSLFEDSEGDLWVGVDASLYLLHNGRFLPVHKKAGKSTGVVVRITEADDHTFYVLTTGTSYSLSRLDKRSLLSEEIPSIPGNRLWDIDYVPGQGLHLALQSADGFALGLYQGDRLSRLLHRAEPIRPTLSHSEDGATWGVETSSVFRWKDGQAGWLGVPNGLPCDHYYSAIQDHEGNLWLYARCGLIEIEKAELERWWSASSSKVVFKLLDAPSGTLPAFASFTPSSVEAVNGHLFFANSNDLQEIDPKQPLPYAAPPPVHIEEIHVDRRSLPVQQGMRLSVLPRDLEIVYTGLCLSVPQKVNFRYRLEGRDATWQDAGTRRQAF